MARFGARALPALLSRLPKRAWHPTAWKTEVHLSFAMKFQRDPQTSLGAKVLPRPVMTEIKGQRVLLLLFLSFITATFSSLFLPTAAF